MKRKYGGGQSKGSAKISWARRELQGRTARVVAEGPDGAPAGTTHPDGCERAPLVETTPNPALNRFWEDTEKFGIHPGFGGAGRGQTWGGGVSYRARQLLSIWSCQWHAVIGQLIVTSPERDQIARLQRDAGQVGKKGREKPLCVARARHAGSEPAWARSQPGARDPLPRCFFLTGPWEEENGRARGAGSLSEKKAIRERREARLMLSQWEQSEPASAASAWDFPKQETHSLWPSSACRGDLHEPQ